MRVNAIVRSVKDSLLKELDVVRVSDDGRPRDAGETIHLIEECELSKLESQIAELREAVWTLYDYVDLPSSDYGTDDLNQAWDLFLKTYRDVQKETEGEEIE